MLLLFQVEVACGHTQQHFASWFSLKIQNENLKKLKTEYQIYTICYNKNISSDEKNEALNVMYSETHWPHHETQDSGLINNLFNLFPFHSNI